MLQSGLIKNLNIDKFDLETFFTLPRDKYDMMLKNLANAPFLPNTIHNLYSTNNFLSRPPFNNSTTKTNIGTKTFRYMKI